MMTEISRRLKLAPSMGCCDLFNLAEEVRFLDQRSDFFHMDIKDGTYVPTFGIGPDFMKTLKDFGIHTPMDAHLMVRRPQDHLEACRDAGASCITVHSDCIRRDAFVTLNRIRDLGCQVGVALSPSEPILDLFYYLPLVDKVTVMLVDPGIAGQPVHPKMFEKIKKLAQLRKQEKLDFLIEADGSMNRDIYGPAYEAGADMVVLGPPALWNKDRDIQKAWEIMMQEVDLSIRLNGVPLSDRQS